MNALFSLYNYINPTIETCCICNTKYTAPPKSFVTQATYIPTCSQTCFMNHYNANKNIDKESSKSTIAINHIDE